MNSLYPRGWSGTFSVYNMLSIEKTLSEKKHRLWGQLGGVEVAGRLMRSGGPQRKKQQLGKSLRLIIFFSQVQESMTSGKRRMTGKRLPGDPHRHSKPQFNGGRNRVCVYWRREILLLDSSWLATGHCAPQLKPTLNGERNNELCNC